MTLIKSISGIRGTIGGKEDTGLTPLDVVKFTAAYAQWLKESNPQSDYKVVVGRDARISGSMVSGLAVQTLVGMGVNVVDLGLSTTPTVEVAVPGEIAQGGIIFTASHNPYQWNALKLLNHKGEFISAAEGERILEIAAEGSTTFANIDQLGTVVYDDTWIDKHIEQVVDLPLVDKELIASAGLKVAVDAVNSSGGIAIPKLLKALGVAEIEELYCEPTGHFPHNPEPLPENVTEIANKVKHNGLDLGIIVDPDVDRLAFISDDGEVFGEEYTLVSVADYVLSKTPGNTVSNLSSTRALKDVTLKHGGEYNAAAVGEVNVVTKMKETDAIIGGEGNGGIIYPAIHYGRDALVGVALFLTHMAEKKQSSSEIRSKLPNYHISKNKIELTPEIDVDLILEKIQEKYKSYDINTIDGVKIHFEPEWVHLRKSNTEPIIRIYTESESSNKAETLAMKIIQDIKEIIK